MKTFKYLVGVAGVGIIVLLLYVWTKPNNSSNTYTKIAPPPTSQGTHKSSNENQLAATKPPSVVPATSVDSTGIIYGNYTEPTADVTAQFNLGSGAGEQQTVTAKKGQRVRITFTANFRDEVKIDGYNAADNVEPMREDATSFIVDKTGSFPIRLIKANKIVGTLKVE